MRISFHASIYDVPLPVVVVKAVYHTIQSHSREEKGLQGFVMHNTGVEPRVPEEIIREKGWYWPAAVPRTVM
jgi:hypothetical protein